MADNQKSLNAKLLLALQNMKDPIKNTEGYNFTYSNLPQITGIIRPALRAQGLDFSQRSTLRSNNEGENKVYILETIVFDDKSEVVLDSRPLMFTNDAQRSGSYETYMRRYALLTVFGLAPKKEDDDGFSTTPEGILLNQDEPAPNNAPSAEAPSAEDETRSVALKRTLDATNAGIKADGIKSYVQTQFVMNKAIQKIPSDDEKFIGKAIFKMTAGELNRYIDHLDTLINDNQKLKEAKE